MDPIADTNIYNGALMQLNQPTDSMKPEKKATPAKFGTILGMAPGNVPVYSSDYSTVDENELPNRHAYRSYLDGHFMGYKWQCVELARRWLYLNKGYVFDEVAMAYDIFRLPHVRVIEDDSHLPLRSFKNGAPRLPEPGSLLIWSEGGEFDVTGHVAVVTEVFPDRIRFVEQNFDHQVWPPGQNYSREIKATQTEDGGYWLECSTGNAAILGWVVQTEDDEYAEPIVELDRRLFLPHIRDVERRQHSKRTWLNVANPDEAAYVAMMHGHKLSSNDADQYKYVSISNAAHKELKRATNELHALFMHATDYVLQNDELLEKFNIPRAIWPKIHQSWDNRRNQMITGRFDFCMTEHGIKVYEYNADSASCYMETGKVQGKWAEHFGCDVGWDPGEHLHEELVDVWKESGVDDVLHIMQDTDLEETYHALFMKEAMERAGIKCKIIKGMAGLSWDADGNVVDGDGLAIKWVWKTWAWETALDQIRAECEDDEERLRSYKAGENRSGRPRLVDVLLRKEVLVYNPLWTLIPSNKAILPVLWMMFPNHPYLLNSQFHISDELRGKGYVAKPIAGRCGFNISVFDKHNHLVELTTGQFEAQNNVYQELCRLPVIDGYNVQLCTFSAGGTYSGSCVRIDPSLVITKNSDMVALRVVNDREFLKEL